MTNQDAPGTRHSDRAEDEGKPIEAPRLRHSGEETDRPASPALEGGPPLPEELTGRASGTSEDLTALFDNQSSTHLADGFRGGSADDAPQQDEEDGAGGTGSDSP
jgi:hypothetical protein